MEMSERPRELTRDELAYLLELTEARLRIVEQKLAKAKARSGFNKSWFRGFVRGKA